MKNPKLKPWLDAGIRRIALHGSKGVNISDMSEELKIAKSSFYNYFNTKEEYLLQLIDYWEEEGTANMIRKVFLHSELDKPVQFIAKEVFETNFINECVLQQFRTSLNDNPMINKKVKEVDQIRTSFLTALISKSDLAGQDAENKARQIYRFFLGTIAHCNLKQPSKKDIQIILNDFSNLFGDI